jgi:hypothetical protein
VPVAIILVVIVPTVPSVPPRFFRVTIIAVTPGILAVIIRSVLLIARVNVNAESTICFGYGWRQTNQSKRCQPQEKISFHIIVLPGLDDMEPPVHSKIQWEPELRGFRSQEVRVANS